MSAITEESAELMHAIESLCERLDTSLMASPMTAEQVAKRWQLNTSSKHWTRQFATIAARLGLKPMELGHQTKRYRPASVLAAEERAERLLPVRAKGGRR